MKWLNARSALYSLVLPERACAGGLSEPWVNGLARIPALKLPNRTAVQVTEANLRGWIEELSGGLSAAMATDLHALERRPVEFLLGLGLRTLAGRDAHLRVTHARTGLNEVQRCVASMSADGLCAARLQLPKLFDTARRMLVEDRIFRGKKRLPSALYAAAPCRDMLCIFDREDDARDANKYCEHHAPSCIEISADVFILTADGVAGTQKEEATC